MTSRDPKGAVRQYGTSAILATALLLVLIFINDLENDILSLKFADDTKVFGRVSNSAQRQLLQLQDDLHKLCVWADMQLADGV